MCADQIGKVGDGMNDIYREPSFWSIIPDNVLSATNIKANAKLLYAKVTSL